jgi:UDP-N-acetylmuramate dehydrogenase
VLRAHQEDFFILGGGSNVLFTQHLEKTILHNQIKGINIVAEDDNKVWVQCGGGEVWHEIVLWAIERGWGGIENLSLIPGTIGAAPIQNIGAYGVELRDVFVSLEAIELATVQKYTFDATKCAFGYRDSYFKREGKGRFFITSVTLCLQKKPIVQTAYGDIQKVLAAKNSTNPDIKAVSDAVIEIRQSKLPNPAEIGNAGSFFKNPEIENIDFQSFIKKHPNAPHYPLADGRVKIPAGWLIEQAGWKGYRKGDAGCHTKQALVLVNYGNANGTDIWQLALQIQEDVFQKFAIKIDTEVNIL